MALLHIPSRLTTRFAEATKNETYACGNRCLEDLITNSSLIRARQACVNGSTHIHSPRHGQSQLIDPSGRIGPSVSSTSSATIAGLSASSLVTNTDLSLPAHVTQTRNRLISRFTAHVKKNINSVLTVSLAVRHFPHVFVKPRPCSYYQQMKVVSFSMIMTYQ